MSERPKSSIPPAIMKLMTYLAIASVAIFSASLALPRPDGDWQLWDEDENGTYGWDNGTYGWDNGTYGWDNGTYGSYGWDNGTSGWDNATYGRDDSEATGSNDSEGNVSTDAGRKDAEPEEPGSRWYVMLSCCVVFKRIDFSINCISASFQFVSAVANKRIVAKGLHFSFRIKEILFNFLFSLTSIKGDNAVLYIVNN